MYFSSFHSAPDHCLGRFVFRAKAAAAGLLGALSLLSGQIAGTVVVADSLTTGDSAPIIPSYRLPAVTVTASRIDLAPLLDPMLRQVPSLATTAEARWIATHLPGSFAVAYGGPGTLQTISTGGGSSAHTAILFDGIPINSPQNGSFDLSTLPISRIGRIEYLPHGGTSVGSGTALSGAVNLVPRKMSTGATFATGDYGLRRSEISFAGDHAGLALGSQIYDGNFSYADGDSTLDRENNSGDLQFLQGRAERKAGATDFVASIWVTQSKKRVAGSTRFPSPRASQTDLWSLLSLSADRSGNQSRQRWQLYWQNQNNTYSDPDWDIHSDHTTRIAGLRYSLHRLWSSALTTLSQISLRRELLTGSDTGDHERTPATLLQQIEVRVLKQFRLMASGRVMTLDLADWWTNSEAALSWKMPLGEPWSFDVAVITAAQLRQPTFNDLYWIPYNNPHLLPERSTMAGARATLAYAQILTARIDQYTTNYEDLIAWVPGSGGGGAPENIHVAWAEQSTFSLDLHSPGDRLSLLVSGTILETANRDEGANQDKRLLYKPQETSSVALSVLLPGDLTWVVQASARSSYIARYKSDYEEAAIQPAAEIWNSYLSWLLSPPAMAYDFNMTLGVANLTDVTHAFIPGYPEPGRAVTLTVQLQKR